MLSDHDKDLLAEIDRRMGQLGRLFDLSRLQDSGTTAIKIRKYYEDSRLGYRLVHSKEGAMHMALNPDGTFDRAGYEGQSRLVEQRFPPNTTAVLELACGNGYNLELLASRHPDTEFVGLDLVQSQVERANTRLEQYPNGRAVVGDFQALAFPDDSYDCVFVIESFCHATDLPKAFAEVRRVLRKHGRFIVIDAWRTDAFDTFPESTREAAASVEHAMAVADARQFGVWKRIATEQGLRVTEDLDLSVQIKPNLDRLARVVETRFVSHPLRVRILQKTLPETLLLNAISGYLMPLTVAAHVHTYRLVMLEPAQ